MHSANFVRAALKAALRNKLWAALPAAGRAGTRAEGFLDAEPPLAFGALAVVEVVRAGEVALAAGALAVAEGALPFVVVEEEDPPQAARSRLASASAAAAAVSLRREFAMRWVRCMRLLCGSGRTAEVDRRARR
jgi:hypothetical protein